MSILDNLVETPIYEDTLPSTGKSVKFRPFVVREERALLMAQESEDTNTMVNTLSSVVGACIIGPKQELTSFDVEYMFVKIRIKSVDENSVLVITCNNCSEKTAVNIPLKSVYVTEGMGNTIKLSDTLAFGMKYPSVDDLIASSSSVSGVAACIKTIYKGDTVTDVTTLSTDEIANFIDTKLTSSQFAMLEKFYKSIPEVRLNLDWKCPKCGQEHNQILKGINDFF